jgi:hypothetical protein
MFLNEREIRDRARQWATSQGKGIEELLVLESRKRQPHYEIFLSQTIRDAELVLGVYVFLTELGYRVFCDWLENPENDRSNVTPANAQFIRNIMSASDSLIVLDTEGADQSLWMCWELGWFDGRNGPIAILPILPEGQKSYRGREFLGLYPYIEFDNLNRVKVVRPVVTGPNGITIIEAPNSRGFENWIKSSPDYMRPRVGRL